MTEEQIKAALTDVQAVAVTVFGEARGADVIGRVAVAWSIRNRLLDRRHRYGADWKGVCLRPKQYSCWMSAGGAANFAAVLAFAEQLLLGAPVGLPSAASECVWVAEGVLHGRVLDPTRGSTHYYADSIVTPKWAQGLQPAVTFGPHRFFNTVT